MQNHTVMRKAIDPPIDHKSDQELGKGRETQEIIERTMMESGYRSDGTTRLICHVGDMNRFPMYKGQVED